MNKYGLTQKEQDEIIALFEKYPAINEVILFGSRAMNTFTKTSDIDFAVKGDGVSRIIGALMGDFEESSIIYEVDVVDYQSITSDALLEHIRKHGKVFYRKGWVETTLGEVAEINPKESLKKGTLAKSVPMDKLASFEKKITGCEVKEFKGGSKFRNGDTLLARITPCLENGKTVYVDILDKNEMAFGSTEYIVIREKQQKSDQQFLFYFSISPHFREVAIKLMTGTSGRQRVQTQQLINYPFVFPPLPEQKSIAAVLSAFDDKIELLREQSQTLETLAQTIFKEWFVNYNCGESIQLSELIEFNPIEKIDRKKEYLFFDMKTISTNSMATSEGVYKKTNSGTAFREGDTLFAKITPCLENGKTAFVLDLKGEPIARGSTEFIVMRAKTNGSPYLNYCICRDNRFREYAIQSMTGTSGRQRAPVDRLKTYNICYSKGNIGKFNDIIEAFFKKIKNNTAQIQTLSKTRDTLLPKLMSGQVRVQ